MIAHIDMDAFFATCEEQRRSELADKPLVICIYTRNKSSGAVSTSNYKARELGISSGMSLSLARQKATDKTVFLEADHEYYREKSDEVFSILRSFTDEIQKTSVDEAYFRLEGNEVEKAKKIKARIETLGLNASIGIAPNKFLAKLASEEDKPDGLRKVDYEERKKFLEGRKLEDLHGIGSKTAQKLQEIGIEKVEDLRTANNTLLVEKLGRKAASSVKNKANGKGSKTLKSGEQKQISKIKTMERNSRDINYIMKEAKVLVEKLDKRIEQKDKAFKSLTVIAIDTNLNHRTKSEKIKTSRSCLKRLEKAEQLYNQILKQNDAEIRRIGLRVSQLVDTDKQKALTKF